MCARTDDLLYCGIKGSFYYFIAICLATLGEWSYHHSGPITWDADGNMHDPASTVHALTVGDVALFAANSVILIALVIWIPVGIHWLIRRGRYKRVVARAN
jgi:hypothetical protein